MRLPILALLGTSLFAIASAHGNEIKIMPLGYSITAGYYAGNGGYRKPLLDLLAAKVDGGTSILPRRGVFGGVSVVRLESDSQLSGRC